MTIIDSVMTSDEQSRQDAKQTLAEAINSLASAKAALYALGAHERGYALHKIMLKVGTIFDEI